MAGILARKLGMTQRFGEDGHVERVTVLQAGPCPVTGIRTAERDGYEAVQLAFGDVREKRLSKPELGHLRKAARLRCGGWPSSAARPASSRSATRSAPTRSSPGT